MLTLDSRSGRIGSGFVVVTRTASAPSAAACRPIPRTARGGAATPATQFRAVAAACPVSGSPFWKVTPGRSSNRQVRGSDCWAHVVASAGRGCPSGPDATRDSVTPSWERTNASSVSTP